MKFSYNWLQSFLDRKLPKPEKLAEILTMAVVEVEGVEKRGDDFSFEIDNKSITNRPDLWGHAGLAREIAAIIKSNSKVYPLQDLRIKSQKSKVKSYNLEVIIKESKLCPRYMGVVIDNVKVSPSPKWMREKLEACGLQTINNIVDVTNYVMLELGQPMHAFDFEKLESSKLKAQSSKLQLKLQNFKRTIIVRSAKKGEKIITLDNGEYDLDENTLVIADSEDPIAIAGIKGGKKAEIDSKTKTIILEAANFEPINIRKSAKTLDLRTEAAIRFEKNLDPNLAETAMNRAITLIKEIIPGTETASHFIDKKSFKEKTQKIRLPFEYINKKIGLEIKKVEAAGILKRLGFEVKNFKDHLIVEIPSWRKGDISIKDDLIEEIARVYGYDNILSEMPKVELKSSPLNLERKLERKIKNILINNFGFSEVYNYSFVGKRQLEKLKADYEDYISLANPISSDQTIMRQSLIPNLILDTKNNLRYFENFRIFEIGRIFTKEKSDNKINKKENKSLPKQEKFIAGVFAEKNNCEPFYKVKHCLGDLFKQLNIDIDFQIAKEKEISSWMHPSRSVDVVSKKKKIGIVSELNPLIAESFGIKEKVGIFEVSFYEIFKLSGEENRYQPILKFPSVVFDLSIIIDRKILWQDIQDLARKIGGHLVRKVEPFDVYEGKNIPADKKSLAFHITYQADDRTLKDEEVKKIEEKIIKGLEEKLGAEIRK